ncbi:DUF5994 family protein [Mycobacterium sp. 21AC1]|uniref:DUF5994 family protein n=1 Tax=[Mycobacterium] appelbergii TaxID=2939269 RepID=UPI0029393E87|nr:DUF5994 family protein [Mycobacterium sp. 21AC1]MDV3129157.1 DUF5994 family protein [Mycobacterium sp. 21AC1]
MSASSLYVNGSGTRRAARQGLRLRLKPAHGYGGFVQGAWWPHGDRLYDELPQLLTALSSRVGPVDRVIYDESAWAPTALRMEVMGRSVILESSGTDTNTLSVFGAGFGRLVLLVVPLYTSPTRAYTAVMTASKPDDESSPDELLGIGPREARDRRQALIAQQRWESEGGALRIRELLRADATEATDKARRTA